MKKRKCILLLLSLLFIKNIYADENNKIEWKEMSLSVDINKDNVKDIIKVQYYENNDKVFVKFTPEITNGKKYESVDNVFDKATFSTEFSPFVNSLINEYSQKEELINQQNNIKQTETIETKQANLEIPKLIKGPYNYKEYYLKARPKNLTFDWHDMIKKIEKTNKFIKNAIDNNQKIYVLDDYTPLGGGSGQFKDKFGNRENQSEKGYLTPEMKEFINIPDRSLMTILEETTKYIKVKIDAYNGVFYINKNVKKLLKDSGIKNSVTRFIYIDRESQNEMIVEKNKDYDTWNVVTTSFVTTGKDSGISYATPYGVFLIAYSKPVMQYTSDKDHTKIVGDAKNAIRFSGGGYMHSIPAVFEPKATINQRKAITASKIGTYAESHKCVRHYDDQIKFIYDWLGNSSPGHKYGYRTPIVPTIMLVK